VQHSIPGDSVQGYALLVMADSYIGLCNFPKVLECLDKALSFSHENEDHLMEIQVLSTMGKVFLALKDFSKALAFQRRAHEIALSNAAYTTEQNATVSSKFVRMTKLKMATPLRLLGDYDGATKCVEVRFARKEIEPIELSCI
jgi:tetratricopeptide (TPR) repeat protein